MSDKTSSTIITPAPPRLLLEEYIRIRLQRIMMDGRVSRIAATDVDRGLELLWEDCVIADCVKMIDDLVHGTPRTSTITSNTTIDTIIRLVLSKMREHTFRM